MEENIISENTLQLIQGLKLLTIVACALLYGLGGMKGKYKRRYIAPGVYILAMSALALWTDTFHWAIPTLYLGYCLPIGYSARDGKTIEIMKRTLAGAAKGLAPLLLVIMTGCWLNFWYHLALCISISVILGVWNPTKSARAEETTIAACYYMIPIMTMI